MGRVRILYRADTISFQAAVHPNYTLGALNMKEEEEVVSKLCIRKVLDSSHET